MAAGDIQCKADIETFIDAFYARLLNDPQLAPLFLDVARIDLSVHQPLIVSYWEKLLLGGKEYRRHTMNIHRQLHHKQALKAADFERWLGYFHATMDSLYNGDTADRAKRIAATIAANMQASLPK